VLIQQELLHVTKGVFVILAGVVKAKKYMIGMFGRGTLLVSSEIGVGGPGPSLGALVRIEECKPSIVGAPIDKSRKLKDPTSMTLFFNSVESIDVVIAHLKWAREAVREIQNGKEV
jgi:hypothetical protein